MGNTEEPKSKVTIKRERYKDGHYYSVGRIDGKRVFWRRWHGSETTKVVEERITEIHEVRTLPLGVKTLDYSPKPGKAKRGVQKFQITLKVTAGSAGDWFVNIQSDHAFLSDAERDKIRLRLLETYSPQSASIKYDTPLTDIKPVLCKNLLDGTKVYFN